LQFRRPAPESDRGRPGREIAADFQKLAQRLGIANVLAIPVSALRGDNVVDSSARMPWFTGPTLLEYLENLPVQNGGEAGPLRLPIQYVLRPDPRFRGFAGQIASGILRRGAAVIALPSGIKTRVKSITTFDGDLDAAAFPHGNIITRAVGGRELIFNRDRAGAVHAFLNTCPHRGAMVVREKKGNALSFRCFYHGWSFNVNGRFASRFEEGNYGKEHNGGGCADLAQAPRLESHRDFWFVNFDKNAVSLSDYLAGAKDYIDIVADHAEAGMEIVGSGQQYIINANWKLLAENSIDAFHGFPVHSTYFDYLKTIGSLRMEAGAGAFSASGMTNLGNGHAVIEYASPWGRPVARWVPSWGEDKGEIVEQLRAGLIKRFGDQRGTRIAEFSRNMLIFPNLVINDIMAITIRTFMPSAPDKMTVSAIPPKKGTPGVSAVGETTPNTGPARMPAATSQTTSGTPVRANTNSPSAPTNSRPAMRIMVVATGSIFLPIGKTATQCTSGESNDRGASPILMKAASRRSPNAGAI
jgi:phenylpropionate dioxygenase-like ring-hydroxylating dioxygenase large terminal subunit